MKTFSRRVEICVRGSLRSDTSVKQDYFKFKCPTLTLLSATHSRNSGSLSFREYGTKSALFVDFELSPPPDSIHHFVVGAQQKIRAF